MSLPLFLIESRSEYTSSLLFEERSSEQDVKTGIRMNARMMNFLIKIFLYN